MFTENNSFQGGFTLIELLWVMMMIGILSALGISSYFVYLDHAEYTKATVTLRNIRPSLEAGEHKLPQDYALGLTFSGTNGGAVDAPLTTLLPGGVTSEDQRVAVLYNSCDPANPGALINAFILSEPCKATRYLTWTRLCNGAQFYVYDIVKPTNCS